MLNDKLAIMKRNSFILVIVMKKILLASITEYYLHLYSHVPCFTSFYLSILVEFRYVLQFSFFFLFFAVGTAIDTNRPMYWDYPRRNFPAHPSTRIHMADTFPPAAVVM